MEPSCELRWFLWTFSTHISNAVPVVIVLGERDHFKKKCPRYIQICYRYRMISISYDILQTFQLSLKSHSLPVHGHIFFEGHRAHGSDTMGTMDLHGFVGSGLQGACSFLGSFSAPSSHYCPGCPEETSGNISTSGAIRLDTNKYGWFMMMKCFWIVLTCPKTGWFTRFTYHN